MKYKVHCYAVVRVPILVEAESHIAAIEKANDENFHQLLDRGEIEYAEEMSYYLVDEEGDRDFDRSQFYDANMRPFAETTGDTK